MSALIAKIHVAAKQLNIQEDDLRSIYNQATGKTSLRAMNSGEHLKIVNALKDKGFKPTSKTLSPAEKQYKPKIIALWIAAFNLGITRSKTDQSLTAYVKRMAGVDHTRFLHHHEDAEKVIESLKKWMTREAKVDWSSDKERISTRFRNMPQGQIVMAQLHKINDDTLTQKPIDVIFTIAGNHRVHPDGLSDQQWIEIMNDLGKRIRDQKSSGK